MMCIQKIKENNKDVRVDLIVTNKITQVSKKQMSNMNYY